MYNDTLLNVLLIINDGEFHIFQLKIECECIMALSAQWH